MYYVTKKAWEAAGKPETKMPWSLCGLCNEFTYITLDPKRDAAVQSNKCGCDTGFDPIIFVMEWKEFEEFMRPVKMIMKCPTCTMQHVDEGEWATRPHAKHLCKYCGSTFYATVTPSFGVA